MRGEVRAWARTLGLRTICSVSGWGGSTITCSSVTFTTTRSPCLPANPESVPVALGILAMGWGGGGAVGGLEMVTCLFLTICTTPPEEGLAGDLGGLE